MNNRDSLNHVYLLNEPLTIEQQQLNPVRVAIIQSQRTKANCFISDPSSTERNNQVHAWFKLETKQATK